MGNGGGGVGEQRVQCAPRPTSSRAGARLWERPRGLSVRSSGPLLLSPDGSAVPSAHSVPGPPHHATPPTPLPTYPPPPHSNHFPFSALRDGSSLPDPTHHFSSQRVCVGVNPCFFPFALCISGLHIGLQRGLVCNRAYTLERALHKQPWHNAHPTMPTPKAVGSRGTGTCHVTCVSHT